MGDNSEATAAELAARPQVQILNNTTLEFENLDVGTNNLIGHNGLAENATHGWEIGLANEVLAGNWSGHSSVGLVKTGQGGSLIAHWYVNASHLYWPNRWLPRVNAAKSELAADNVTPEFSILYSHGINDAVAGTNPTTWRTDTVDHFAKMRTEVGPTTPIYVTKLPTPAYDTFNTEIDTIVAGDPYTFAIETSDLVEVGNHWDYASLKVIAQRFVAAISS